VSPAGAAPWYTAVHDIFHQPVASGVRMALMAREAGERVGKTRQAIIKAIKKGTLSAEKDTAGEWRIEPVELFRVYPPVPPVDDNQPVTESANDTGGLQREIALLRERIDDLVEDRDRWRDQAERTMTLLTDQRPPRRRRWWPWG
jgi:hypothetical protein